MHLKNYLVNEWWLYVPHCFFMQYKMHDKANQKNFDKYRINLKFNCR